MDKPTFIETATFLHSAKAVSYDIDYWHKPTDIEVKSSTAIEKSQTRSMWTFFSFPYNFSSLSFLTITSPNTHDDTWGCDVWELTQPRCDPSSFV